MLRVMPDPGPRHRDALRLLRKGGLRAAGEDEHETEELGLEFHKAHALCERKFLRGGESSGRESGWYHNFGTLLLLTSADASIR